MPAARLRVRGKSVGIMRAIAFGKVDSGTLGSRLSEASAFVTGRAALNAILVITGVLFRYFTARMLGKCESLAFFCAVSGGKFMLNSR